MTFRHRDEARHPGSAPPPNPLTTEDFEHLGDRVGAALSYMQAENKQPRGHDTYNAAVEGRVTATIAGYEKPEKTLCFTANTTVERKLFNACISHDVQEAKEMSQMFNQHYRQARLRELQAWPENNRYGWSEAGVGEYLLNAIEGTTNTRLRRPSQD